MLSSTQAINYVRDAHVYPLYRSLSVEGLEPGKITNSIDPAWLSIGQVLKVYTKEGLLEVVNHLNQTSSQPPGVSGDALPPNGLGWMAPHALWHEWCMRQVSFMDSMRSDEQDLFMYGFNTDNVPDFEKALAENPPTWAFMYDRQQLSTISNAETLFSYVKAVVDMMNFAQQSEGDIRDLLIRTYSKQVLMAFETLCLVCMDVWTRMTDVEYERIRRAVDASTVFEEYFARLFTTTAGFKTAVQTMLDIAITIIHLLDKLNAFHCTLSLFTLASHLQLLVFTLPSGTVALECTPYSVKRIDTIYAKNMTNPTSNEQLLHTRKIHTLSFMATRTCPSPVYLNEILDLAPTDPSPGLGKKSEAVRGEIISTILQAIGHDRPYTETAMKKVGQCSKHKIDHFWLPFHMEYFTGDIDTQRQQQSHEKQTMRDPAVSFTLSALRSRALDMLYIPHFLNQSQIRDELSLNSADCLHREIAIGSGNGEVCIADHVRGNTDATWGLEIQKKQDEEPEKTPLPAKSLWVDSCSLLLPFFDKRSPLHHVNIHTVAASAAGEATGTDVLMAQGQPIIPAYAALFDEILKYCLYTLTVMESILFSGPNLMRKIYLYRMRNPRSLAQLPLPLNTILFVTTPPPNADRPALKFTESDKRTLITLPSKKKVRLGDDVMVNGTEQPALTIRVERMFSFTVEDVLSLLCVNTNINSFFKLMYINLPDHRETVKRLLVDSLIEKSALFLVPIKLSQQMENKDVSECAMKLIEDIINSKPAAIGKIITIAQELETKWYNDLIKA